MIFKISKLSLLPRITLFEFNDQSWYPKLFRSYLTDILGYLITKHNIYSSINSMVKDSMKELDCNEIIDLCSGSGEPALQLKKALMKDIPQVKLILTDKYPDTKKFIALSKSNQMVEYRNQSIDAACLPDNLKGFRTLFASFHHFKREHAKKILQDAVNNNSAIGVFEFTERNWLRVFFMLIGILQILVITPFIKPFSIKRLFWTYVLPVVPLTYFWDGLISNLRTYQPDELNGIISNLGNHHSFEWKVGKLPTKLWPIKITYLIGCPLNKLNNLKWHKLC